MGKNVVLKIMKNHVFVIFPYIRKIANLEQLLIYLQKQLESCIFLWGLFNEHILILYMFSIVDLSPSLLILPPNLAQNAFLWTFVGTILTPKDVVAIYLQRSMAGIYKYVVLHSIPLNSNPRKYGRIWLTPMWHPLHGA